VASGSIAARRGIPGNAVAADTALAARRKLRRFQMTI
jgi:hypothetical protein